MSDLALLWGTDLAVGPTGDLALVEGTVLGQQRVLRRLLTNTGDYIWQPDYGAGLAGFVGSPVSTSQICAVISSQILKEPIVASTPAPVVNVDITLNGQFNMLFTEIKYSDSISGQAQVLNFTVGQ